MPKVEEIEKEIYLQVRKRKNKLVITGRKKVVYKPTQNKKGGCTDVKVFEYSGNKSKRKSKGKRDKMGQKT